MRDRERRIDGLLSEIRQAANPAHGDRGKLAALRRGFSETTAHYAWPHIVPYCDMTDTRLRILWLTVAAAAATLIPDDLVRENIGNMGATMRRLALGESGSRQESLEKTLSSFEARFRRLLTCQTTEELCRHLVRVIRAAAASKKHVDVKKLYWDLLNWENREERDVRIEWAQGYWVAEREEV